MQKLKTTAAEMVAAARARIEEVETLELIALVEDPDPSLSISGTSANASAPVSFPEAFTHRAA